MLKLTLINLSLMIIICNSTKGVKRAGFLVSTPILYNDQKNSDAKRDGKSNVLKSQNGSHPDSAFEFSGFDDVFNRSLLFSKDAIELTKEDMIAREADYESYKNVTLDKMKQFITIVTSTIAVGILYQALVFFKRILEQQHTKIVNDDLID